MEKVTPTLELAPIDPDVDEGEHVAHPTPFAGAVYVFEKKRVHPVDVPFSDAVRTVSQWGAGAKALVAAMESQSTPHEATLRLKGVVTAPEKQ